MRIPIHIYTHYYQILASITLQIILSFFSSSLHLYKVYTHVYTLNNSLITRITDVNIVNIQMFLQSILKYFNLISNK